MKVVAALTLALALGGAAIPAKAPRLPVEKPATLLLGFSDGSCSGTAVGPSLVLTAAHCMEGGPLQAVNGKPAKVGAVLDDGNDHVLLVVEGVVFPRYATIDPRPMVQGQHFRIYGNPGGLRDLYREGYVMGFEQGWIVSDLIVFRGDSGSGIFSKHGYVVGVVSTMFAYGENFHGMGAKPLAFTREQYAQVGL